MQHQLVGQRYRIKGLIGEGGMASVYAALDEKLDRRVAIKVLHAHLARNPDIRERFLLEAKTVSTLDHPNIIKVYDFSGLDSEQLWIVTEILYGVDLAEFVKRFTKQRLHPLVATLVTREISRALSEVHKLQIVHRDIKPENIMILDSGHVKLMDFGIAKVHRAKATQTGTFMGSPSYMSPEQIRGTDVDVRADIYSLCVLFYEIITGTLPYAGQSTAEVINKIMVGRYTPPNLLNPDIPYAINEVVVRGMQSHKDQRFRDIQEMIQALDLFLQGHGFGESRHELEEFVLHRTAFEDRLSQIKYPKSTPAPRGEPTLQLNEAPVPLGSTRSHRGQQHSQSTEPRHNPSQNHSRAPRTVAPQQDGHSSHRSRPPRSVTPHQDGEHDTRLTRGHAPHKRSSVQGSSHPTIPLHEPQEFADEPRSYQPQSYQPQSFHPQSFHPQSQYPQGGLPPPPAPYPSPRVARRPTPRQAVHGVYEIADVPRRDTKSTYVLVALVAAIIAVLIFGGDRLSNRLKRDSGRVAQQLEDAPKKKHSREEENGEESVLISPPPPSSPSKTGDTKTADNRTVLIESQATTIDSNTRNPPRSNGRDITTPRNTKTLPSTSRTVAVNVPGSLKPNPLASSPASPPTPATSGAVPNTRPNSAPKDTRPSSPEIAMVPETSRANLPPDRAERSNPSIDTIPNEKPSRREAGFLKVASLPAAEILVDGKLLGTTNDSGVIKLDPGSYQLRFRRKGYKTEEQTVMIRGGETRNISVSLAKSVDLVEFNIHTNRIPTSVVVEDLRDGGRRREMVLNKYNTVLNLRPGKYRVLVNYDQDVINRVLELNETERSITFNAEFK